MQTIADLFVPLLFVGFLLVYTLFSGREYWDPLLAWLRPWRQRPRFALWRAAAEGAGLERVTVDRGRHVVLGWSGELHVRLELPPAGAATSVVVGRSGHQELELSLRPEGLSTALGKRVAGEREVRVGAPSFDDEFFIQGEAALVLAVLDAETRAALARLVGGRVVTREGNTLEVSASLAHGALDVRVEDARLWGSQQLASEVIAAVLEVARRLVVPRDLAARIAENLRTEPEPGVRLQCVEALAREFPGHPATRQALLAAREDPDLEVRLRAGIALGPAGRDELLAIAGADGTPDATAARAVAALASDLPADEASAMLGNALRTRRLATARECLRVLGRRGPAAVPTLAKVLAVERSERLAASAAEVRAAAVQALGRVGTTGAVPPLRELEERDRSCRAAARQAIAEIQSRTTGAGPGQLALAGAEAGGLSLADGEAGALSLAEGKGPGPAVVPQGDEGGRSGRRLRTRGKRQADG